MSPIYPNFHSSVTSSDRRYFRDKDFIIKFIMTSAVPPFLLPCYCLSGTDLVEIISQGELLEIPRGC